MVPSRYEVLVDPVLVNPVLVNPEVADEAARLLAEAPVAPSGPARYRAG